MWVWLRQQACLILVMYMVIMYATSTRNQTERFIGYIIS